MSQSKFKLMCAQILTSAVMGLSTLPAYAEGNKPDSFKIGITNLMSYSVTVSGRPVKAVAQLYIQELNAAGGIDGWRLALIRT